MEHTPTPDRVIAALVAEGYEIIYEESGRVVHLKHPSYSEMFVVPLDIHDPNYQPQINLIRTILWGYFTAAPVAMRIMKVLEWFWLDTSRPPNAAAERAKELNLAGYSLRWIGKMLISEGYRPPHAEQWHPTTVARLIKRS